MTDQKTQLVELSDEEAKIVQIRLKTLIDELGIQMVVAPIITKEGTLSAQLQILKKVSVEEKGVEASEFLKSLDNEEGSEEKGS